MRGKTAAMILTGAALLVLLVVLKHSIGSAADTPARAVASDDGEPVPSEPVATAPATPGSRDAKIPTGNALARVPVAPDPSASSGGAPVLAPGGAEADAERPVKRPPVVNKTILREQVEAIAPLVDACVASATGKLDGTAAMSFIVAPKGNEAVIEMTAVDYDGSTIQNEALLDCLHKTALQMRFAPTPDSDAVVAKREVVVENGKVTTNRLVDFSYLRK
jgi:hypothetical protein